MGGKQSMITVRIDAETDERLEQLAESERRRTGIDSIKKAAIARKLLVASLGTQGNHRVHCKRRAS